MSKMFCENGGNQSWKVWVSLKENIKMAEYKMAKLKTAEFKMAAIIKLSQNEWVKFFLCKLAESMMAEFKMADLPMAAYLQVNQIELVWVRVRLDEWVWVRLN